MGCLLTVIIGIGASPAGPVLAGPLFQQFNKIHLKNCRSARLLQLDHFKSPSYASGNVPVTALSYSGSVLIMGTACCYRLTVMCEHLGVYLTLGKCIACT